MRFTCKIVLLPGLDGTGRLFSSFVKILPEELMPQIISYPIDAPLGYLELENYVAPRLETDMPFIIVAESFSGPLAIRLAASAPTRTAGGVRRHRELFE